MFRAYKEFYNLHESLKKEFPKQLPQFPHKIYLRKSEVKSIAKQRASDLSEYLQVQSEIVNLLINPRSWLGVWSINRKHTFN